MKELMVPFNAPLREKDSENQTEGCRVNNPDICASNMIPEVCAFCTVIIYVKGLLERGKSNTIS